MKKKSVFFAVAFCLLAAVCLTYICGKRGGSVAKIYSDGELIRTVRLDEAEEPYTIDINRHNTVLVEKGRISMCYADCPDKLCVKTGAVSDGTKDIVCLPNKIIIRIEEK